MDLKTQIAPIGTSSTAEPALAGEVNYEVSKVHRFVIPGGLFPSSVDPLEIDQFSNYFPGQMIYHPPLQVTLDGKLESKILSSFSYNEDTRTITMKIGTWTYSDGTAVTIQDVALAVKRMLLKRPNFPVSRYIIGAEHWIKLKTPLKKEIPGIQISTDTLTIKLSQNVYQPLFRLCLNIFSVIPEKCVNLEKNELACLQPPSSGYYVRASSVGKKILYALRKDLPEDIAESLPRQILFDYEISPIADLLADSTMETVVYGYDLNFTSQEHADLRNKYNLERLPAAWFTGFVLNPRVEPFANRECRYWFAQKFRETFAQQELGPVEASASIFTKLHPGYTSDFNLATNQVPPSASAQEKCITALKKSEFVYAIRTQSAPPLFEKALKMMADKHGFKIAPPVIAPSSHCGWPSYPRSDVALQLSNSGFWPLDPVGDIQMLLSGLHEDYMDIHPDKEIQKILRDISESYSLPEINVNMARLNQALFNRAYFNIFSNQSYFYLSRKDKPSRKGAPFSVTLPYPWQVF